MRSAYQRLMTSANMKKILGAVAALLVCGQVMAAGPGESKWVPAKAISA
jgi:hypothetical protein